MQPVIEQGLELFSLFFSNAAELVSVNLISNRVERFVLMFAQVTNLPTSH